MPEVIDGKQHPRAREVLDYIDTMTQPYQPDLMKTRFMTLLKLHMQLGRDVKNSDLSGKIQRWFEASRLSARKGRYGPELMGLWALVNGILASPPPEPLPYDPSMAPPPRRVPPPVVTRAPMPVEQESMGLTHEQRQKLLALKVDGVGTVHDEGIAESVFWHFLFLVRDMVTSGVNLLGPTPLVARDPEIRAFLIILEDVRSAGGLTKVQAEMLEEMANRRAKADT